MDRHAKEWLALGVIFLLVFALLGGLTLTSRGIAWNYLASVVIIIAIYALFALTLSLEFGQTGLLNFGAVAFMGIGAYTAGIMVGILERDPFFVEQQEFIAKVQGTPFEYLTNSPPLSTHLTGVTAPGFLVCLLAALLAGVIATVPVVLLVQRLLPERIPSRVKTLSALAVGGVVALVVLLSLFPLSPHGARNAVAMLAILAGMLLAALGGLLLGLPTVRLREDYLAIVTIGAAEILRSVFVNEGWLTRGTLGIQRLQRPLVDWATGTEWWENLADSLEVNRVALAHMLAFVLAVAFVYMVFEVLARSPWGRVLKAIREDEDVATALGKNVFWYKLQSLMLGSAVGALAGVFLVWHLSNVAPEHFLPIVTFYGFIIVVVGGVGNHRGAIAGAIVLWGVFELAGNLTVLQSIGLRELAGPPQAIFIGLMLVIVMMFRPQGILGRKEEMLYAK